MPERLLDTSDLAPPSHLPPREAWVEPERWLDGPVEKLATPVDDRGFVKIDDTIELVKGFFVPGFEWQYTVGDPRTAPDEHHFYNEAEDYMPHLHDGDVTAWAFRALAVNIGYVPRQFHNALHHCLNKVPVPDSADMAHYIESYMIARSLLKDIDTSAKNTLNAIWRIRTRRLDVAQNPDRISGKEYDVEGESSLLQFHRKHHTTYEKSLEAIRPLIEHDGSRIKVPIITSKTRPKDARRKISRAAIMGSHVNYLRIIGARRVRSGSHCGEQEAA